MKRETVALATVTTANFLPGTMVMLDSFLRNNGWFDGDLVVIHQDLSKSDQSKLQTNFEQIKFVSPRQTLVDNVENLVQVISSFNAQKAQFLSIEAIGLIQYDRVLFCDSDLLFQMSVQPLLNLPHPLICCGDGAFYRGTVRHPKSFVEMTDDPGNIGLRYVFNAGFMVMDKSIRTQENVTKLIDLIDPDQWHGNVTGHTDQLLFNGFFDGKQHIVGPEYNYVLLHHKEILKKSGLGICAAKVLHFNGPAKPWNPVAIQHLIKSDLTILDAAALWNDAYRKLIARCKKS